VFEEYMLDNREFCNVRQDGKVTGFQVSIRIPYYRGVCLAMLQDLKIAVDGEAFPRESLKFTLGGRTYTLDEMKNVTDVNWGFGQFATLTVSKPGGLTAGPHAVELRTIVATGPNPGPTDPAAIEGRYQFTGSRPGIGKVTKKMTLVQ
jgi:hypothetical protein